MAAPFAIDRANGVAPQISGAISKASQSTGISFQYLLTTAKIESSLNPQAQASTSSAKGLYQFIEQTWLGTVKQDGAAHGLGSYADAITKNSDGRYEVSDPATRAEIMKLRTDPDTSAAMAGALARNNAEYLSGAIGRSPTEGELYAAHFLGQEGAGRLINAASSNGNANAASMFPAAAAANKPIFYNRDGSARSVSEVYDRLTAKFDNARVAVMRPPGDIPNVTTVANAKSLSSPVPDTAGVAQALASADNRPPAQSTRPMFASMFSDPARGAVSSTVTSLWSDTSTTAASAASNATPVVQPQRVANADAPVRTLELFTDQTTSVRGLFNGRG